MNDFEMINDEALDEVAGGISFDLGFVSADLTLDDGLSVTSDIGSLQIDSPLSIAGDIIGTATSGIADLLNGFADQLTKLGQLFDFS
jgi:hypothetical protein